MWKSIVLRFTVDCHDPFSLYSVLRSMGAQLMGLATRREAELKKRKERREREGKRIASQLANIAQEFLISLQLGTQIVIGSTKKLAF